jgi:hypothetical protein
MLVIVGAQVAPDVRENLQIVVDHEKEGLVHAEPLASSATGSATRNSVRPGLDSTAMSPSLWMTRRRTMSRPRPVPSPAGLVVKKGSKIRSRISAGMPDRCRRCGRRPSRPRGRPGSRHASLGDGVERVVDQVAPDLIELAGEARTLGRSGSSWTDTATAFARAFAFSTATVFDRLWRDRRAPRSSPGPCE